MKKILHLMSHVLKKKISQNQNDDTPSSQWYITWWELMFPFDLTADNTYQILPNENTTAIPLNTSSISGESTEEAPFRNRQVDGTPRRRRRWQAWGSRRQVWTPRGLRTTRTGECISLINYKIELSVLLFILDPFNLCCPDSLSLLRCTQLFIYLFDMKWTANESYNNNIYS